MSSGRAFFLVFSIITPFFLHFPQSAESITVKNSALDYIKAVVPKEVVAGEEFEVIISFVDRFENSMPPEWKPSSSLSLTASRPASVLPPILSPENYLPNFRFRVSTEKMGQLVLTLRNEEGQVLEEWNLIVRSGPPVKLVLDLQDEAQSGETVFISFSAVDMHGNVAIGYEPDSDAIVVEGGAVQETARLRKAGEGSFEMPVLFIRPGKQSVTVRDRGKGLTGVSEEINIVSAPLASQEIDPLIKREKVPASPAVKIDEKEKARIAAELARKEAIRARRVAKLRDKKIKERQVSRIQPIASSATRASIKPDGEPAVESTAAQQNELYPEKPEGLEDPKNSEKVPFKITGRKSLMPVVLDGVVVKEADNYGIVSFSTNGITEYNVSTSAKLSRKWINIEFPFVKPELPAHLTGGSDIIGAVYAEKPETGKGIMISLEILPDSIGYEIYQEGDCLILKVTRQ